MFRGLAAPLCQALWHNFVLAMSCFFSGSHPSLPDVLAISPVTPKIIKMNENKNFFSNKLYF